jgi:RNA polymerase sigma factor, sigma-70 family
VRELEEYIEAHQDSFYRLAFSYVKDPDAALDVVQNAVVQALTNAHTLRERAYMKTWFYRILVNESLGYLRKNRRYLPMEPREEGFAFEDGDVGERLDVYRAVGRLNPKLRTVVVLRYFEDMPLAEIARVTGANLSTVKSRLYKALAVLKADMEIADEP